MHYLVKWKGYPTSENSWELKENIHVEEVIKEFHEKDFKHNETRR